MFNLIDIGSSFAVMLGKRYDVDIIARVNSSLLPTLDISYWPLMFISRRWLSIFWRSWKGLFCPPFLAAAGFSLWVWPTRLVMQGYTNNTESLSGWLVMHPELVSEHIFQLCTDYFQTKWIRIPFVFSWIFKDLMVMPDSHSFFWRAFDYIDGCLKELIRLTGYP